MQLCLKNQLVMLLLLLASNVYIVRDQRDLSLRPQSESTYFAGNVSFDLSAPLEARHGYIDCMNHSLIAETQPFSSIYSIKISNCAFELRTPLAATIDRAVFVNVVISCAAGVAGAGCASRVSDSELYGVAVAADSQFVSVAENCVFVGCSFSLTISPSQSPSAQRSAPQQPQLALIGNAVNCTVQNSLLRAQLAVNQLSSAAGLALRATDLLITLSRIICEISAAEDGNEQFQSAALSGCVGLAGGTVVVKNCDYIANISVLGRFQMLSGAIAAAQPGADVAISNFSVCTALSGVLSSTGAAENVRYAAGVLGLCNAARLQLDYISSFVDFALDFSNSTADYAPGVFAAGLAAKVSQTLDIQTQISNCFTVGEIALSHGVAGLVAVGGCVGGAYADINAKMTLHDLTFSGKIQFSVLEGTSNNSYIAGVAGDVQNTTLNRAQFYGDLSVLERLRYDGEVNQEIDGGLIIGMGIYGSVLDGCFADGNFSIEKHHQSHNNNFAGLAGIAVSITNSLVLCQMTVQSDNQETFTARLGLLVGIIYERLENCSIEGQLSLSCQEHVYGSGSVGGIAGHLMIYIEAVRNVFISANMTVVRKHSTLAAAFGTLDGATLSKIVVAVAFSGAGGVNVPAYIVWKIQPIIYNVFVNCELAGNAAQPGLCSDGLTNGAVVAQLSPYFAYNPQYNGQLPFLTMLPVRAEPARYELPKAGKFNESFYYIDGGLFFPKTDFQICRGACYGTYSSAVFRTCDGGEGTQENSNPNNNDARHADTHSSDKTDGESTTNTAASASSYCIDVNKAESEFPADSCLSDNAVCSPAGASVCESTSELLIAKNGTYRCVLGCPGCKNGVCMSRYCFCELYHSGPQCVYECDADVPVCFGNIYEECAADSGKCEPIYSCEHFSCAHGACVELPNVHCACENLWTGERCERCEEFGTDCDMSVQQCASDFCHGNGACQGPYGAPYCSCERNFDPLQHCAGCAAGMRVIDDQCGCGASGDICGADQYCYYDKCEQNCKGTVQNCMECNSENFYLCGTCMPGYNLKNGDCERYDAEKMNTIVIVCAVVAGCAGATAIALGAYLIVKANKAKKANADQYDKQPDGNENARGVNKAQERQSESKAPPKDQAEDKRISVSNATGSAQLLTEIQPPEQTV